MDLMDLAVKGSIVAAVAMVIGLIWIARRGHFERETLSEEDAGHFVAGGALGPRPFLTRFKGRAWGASWGTVIATRDVITMLREGRYSEAAPWVVAILGTMAALFCWPLLLALVLGASEFGAIALAAFFGYFTVRAAWPRDDDE